MMILHVMASEALKLKRTLIPWLSAVGGFFPALVALLFLATGSAPVTWEALWGTGLNFLNMLALLLIAIFAGHPFIMEYNSTRINMLFAYPVPRLLVYAVKLFMVFLPVLGMYLVFAASTAVSGLLLAENRFLDSGLVADLPGLLLLTAGAGAALIPLTAAVSITVKNTGAYILSGIGYFIVYMSFTGSEFGKYIPVCIPDRLMGDYLAAGRLLSPDTGVMMAVCAAVFVIMFAVGAACYVRLEM